MAVEMWTSLRCDCGSELFTPVFRIKYKSGGGTTTEPKGHRCTACGAVVDNAYMIKLIEINEKRRQLKELTEELAEAPKVQTEAPAAGRR